MINDMIYDLKQKSKIKMYKIWKKFGTPPSQQRKERAIDIEECMKIDDMIELAKKREEKRQEAIAEAKTSS